MRTPLARLAAVTAVATYLLVVLGAIVRATGSGLGCPDWPTCHGSWVPPLERAALIEYSHRSLAALVGVMVLAVVALAWRSRVKDRRSWWLSLTALGLLVVQGWLGRQVVLTELSAPLVGIHLGTAMALLAVMLLVALPQAKPQTDPSLATRMWFGAGAVLAVILAGALVRGYGAGLAFADWPLMDGGLIPTFLSPSRLVHFAHRILALAAGIYLLYLWRFLRGRDGAATTFAGLVLAFYVLQASIGAATVFTRLAGWSVVAHVAVAALTWAQAFLLPFSRSLVEARA